MRYLKKEIWARINCDDKAIREEAEIEWNNCIGIYDKEFEIIRKRLPHRFVKQFLCREGLHDYTICGLTISKRRRSYSCCLQLTDGMEDIMLTMEALSGVFFDIPSIPISQFDYLQWGYCEFEITERNHIKLSVICDPVNEMHFEFKTIKLKILRQQDRGRISRTLGH